MLYDHSVRLGVTQSLQLKIFQSVTHSSRPLRLLEISTKVDSSPKQHSFNINASSLRGSRNTKSVVRAACGPLIEILADDTVSIIHHSSTEHLINPERDIAEAKEYSLPSIVSAISDKGMAVSCINYLTSDWANDYECEKDKTRSYRSSLPSKFVAAYAKHLFLKYASSSLSYHASQVHQRDKELLELNDRFLGPDSKAFASWLELEETRIGISDTSALHVASGKGLAYYVEYLIQAGQDVNGLDSKNRAPVHRAAAKGHSEVVKVLLKRGAKSDPGDDCGLKSLHLAASGNHAGVVKILLESGVDAKTPKTREHPGRRCGSAPTTRGNTAVMYAFEYGHTEAALEVLP